MTIFFRELRSLATEALDTYIGLSESIMLTAVALCRALLKATISPSLSSPAAEELSNELT